MPKTLRKNRLQHPRSVKSNPDDDNESIDDGVSLWSNLSDVTSIYDETETGYSTSNESTISSDLLDDRLDTMIDDLRNKDFKTRENALQTLQRLFCQKYLSDHVSQRSENLVEVLFHCLKRGNEIEKILAANVTSLFIVQLGETNEELFQRFHDVLLPIIRDESQPSSVRSKFCQTLGLLCFLLSEDVNSTVDLMKHFERIFSLVDDSASSSALMSWCLLVSTLPTNFAHETIRLFLPEKIPNLIESNDAELRNQAGEVIAILYEIARDIGSIFAQPSETLLLRLEEKSTESTKSKGKKEKRIQRSTFREIYQSLDEGKTPEFDVKFGREVLQINSWTKRFYYNLFSHLLSAGILVHLRSNNFLRSIFNLTEVKMIDEEEKSSRFDRHLANKVAFKLRTEVMKKTRATKALRHAFDD